MKDGQLAIVGFEEGAFNCKFARISIVDRNGALQFDDIFQFANACTNILHEAIYLAETNEILAVAELGANPSHLMLVKFDVEARAIIWHKVYDLVKDAVIRFAGMEPVFNGPIVGRSITKIGDHGFVVAGSISARVDGKIQDPDVLVLRVSNAGRITWGRACGGTRSDQGFTVRSTEDHGVLVGGQTYSKGTSFRGWFFRLNSAGELIWEIGSRLPVQAVGTNGDRVFLMDAAWQTRQWAVMRDKRFGSPIYWGGEHTWTGNVFSLQSKPALSELSNPALTCRNLYYVPSWPMGNTDARPSFKDLRMN